jgi:aminoglycoside 2'-N-acetyltransferase I
MIFTTTRLRIRKAQPTDDDIEMYFRLWTDGRVMANVGFPKGIPITIEELRRRLESESNSEYNRLLVIERLSDGQRVGECKLGLPDENNIAETDVKLLPEFWGHAYGVEVKRGLLDYLFTHTDCIAVHASPNIKNIPSIRMQEAVGGIRIDEGVYEFPEEMRAFTQPVHCYIYQVTRQAWEALPRLQPSAYINIQIKAASQLTPSEQKSLSDLLERVFRDDPHAGLSYATTEWNVLVYAGDVLASNVDIVQRAINAGERTVRVGGIGGVATLPEYRGRGLASQAMSAAMKFVKDDLGLDFGVLLTNLHRQTFYEGMGWKVISEPAYFDQPSGKVVNDGLTMILALTGKPWPPGEVDFCGLPF